MSESLVSNRVAINAAFLLEIKQDHQQLDHILRGLRQMTDCPSKLARHYQDFVEGLYRLCDQLAFHFALEEAYGYFDDALESVPHLHEQSSRLRSEHVKLFIAARDLADKAADPDKPDLHTVRKGISQFKQFDVALRVHESAEKGLIFAAINDDVGVGD